MSVFKNHYLHVTVSFLFALVLSLLCMRLVYHSDLDNNKKLFIKEAQRQSTLLSLLIQKDIDFIGAGANFYQSSSQQDWQQFPLFAHSLLASSHSLISLQWMQKVEKLNVQAHIQKVKKEFPSFTLYTVPKDKPKTYGYIMPNDEPIYIATDIYPRDERNIPLLGFYSSRKRFQLVIEQFLDTGLPTVSDKVRLLQDSLDQGAPKTGMLVYHPVFTADKKSLKGVMVGVVRITSYFKPLIGSTSLGEALVVKIVDTGFDAEDNPVMFESEKWDQFNGLAYTETVRIQNREWKIQYKSQSKLTNNQRNILFWMSIGALVVSMLIAIITFMITRDKTRIEALLVKRTKELHYMAMHDDLTGLLNRRSITSVIENYIKEDLSFSLICFDIDNFKHINDSHGHPDGDKVLIHITQLISTILGDNADFARLGGDEFVLVMKIDELTQLTKIARELHLIVHTSPTMLLKGEVHQTISVGAALRKKQTAEELIKQADQALYTSKDKGRNQVTIFG